ncbi:MAG TPA: hypothetical protein VGM15_08200 [Burkholderiaceae bacterium]|jgi:hypothetical protein
MNFKRPRHREDVLFVIALVIPAVLSAARYFQTERQMTQIARAQSASAQVALDARPATSPGPEGSTLALHSGTAQAGVRGQWTPAEATGAL